MRTAIDIGKEYISGEPVARVLGNATVVNSGKSCRNAPIAGCREHARVTEEIDLFRGRVVRYVGEVRARSQASIRSVGSPRGWFQLDQGLDCWLQFPMPFVNQTLVGYPFPGERVTIISQSRTQVVIGAVAPRFQYRELDYVNPATDLIYRVDDQELTRALFGPPP